MDLNKGTYVGLSIWHIEKKNRVNLLFESQMWALGHTFQSFPYHIKMLKWKKHLFSKSSMNTVPVCELHRWALSPISVMSDIGLSLNRTVRYRTERLKICRIFRYRTKVFCDIRYRYQTSKFLKSWCTRSLKGTFSRKRFLEYLFKC
jgi:hypothetical protein